MQLGILELVNAYRVGRLEPQRVLEEVYEHIERVGQRPVWISLKPLESAMAALKSQLARNPNGPLLGVIYRQSIAQLETQGWQSVTFDLEPFFQVAGLFYDGTDWCTRHHAFWGLESLFGVP